MAEHIASLTPERAHAIGRAAMKRVLVHHTYEQRAVLVEALLSGMDTSHLHLVEGV